MVQTVPERSEIPVEHTWDVYSVFPNDEAWEAAYQQDEQSLESIAEYAGRLGEGPDVLADFLAAQEEIYAELGKVYVYASMHYAVDTADGHAKALSDRAGILFARTAAATAFGEPEIIAIGFDTLRDWCQQDERLRVYTHYFDTLERRQEHVRSAEVEELLGAVADPFGAAEETHGILTNADLTFRPACTSEGEEVMITQGTYHGIMASPDRELRRTAWESYADAHLAFKNTMANCISCGVKDHVFNARARRYNSALEAALGPNHIPTEVFYNLIEAFKKNLPTWHRYWRIRRQALGVDTLRVYDTWAPLGSKPPAVEYAQGVEWITQGMAPLGQEYVETLRRGATSERWVDIYPNQRKTNGAFSTGWKGTHPFILMSFTGDVFSVSTLAHELGHSLHSYLAWQNQPLQYSWYGIFLAEVASNFNQALVRAHMLRENDDPDFQLAVLEEAMYNFHRYFFVMPTLARFELEIHQRVERGEALTADSLMELLTGLFREAYGEEMEIDEPRVGITWAEFSTHLYGNFYVWQYATGISAANALATGVIDEGQPAADRYLEFLRSGSSRYPLDILSAAGVDMTSPEPVDRAFRVLADMVDRLEGIIEARSGAGVS